MIVPSIYFIIGVGVSIALCIEMRERYPTQFSGATLIVGAVMSVVFWPVILVSLATLILIAFADRRSV